MIQVQSKSPPLQTLDRADSFTRVASNQRPRALIPRAPGRDETEYRFAPVGDRGRRDSAVLHRDRSIQLLPDTGHSESAYPGRALRRLMSAVFVLSAVLVLPPTSVLAAQALLTHAETSGFTDYTPYSSMMTFLAEVQSRSPEMRVGIYGESHDGRALPYAVFSRPSVAGPDEARALGRPILVLAAGVHGVERTLRESVLLLTRDLATRGTAMNDALDHLTILVVPQINPDGFSTEPSAQRGNRWGLDLNRDYMKLEQPEIRGYVQNVLLAWRPHLFIDGHNGGAFPYNINYQCPSHPGGDLRLTALCDERIFPAVDDALEAEGYLSWYYQAGNRTRWTVGGTDPRIGRNYGGLANMVGILFESPGGQSMADGVRSGVLAYQAVVDWARDNPELLRRTVSDAIEETLALGSAPSGEIPIEVVYAPEDYSVEYLIAVGTGDEREVLRVESDSLMKRPVATLTRPRPWAYLIPPDAVGAVDLLLDHRILVERLDEPVEAVIHAYTLSDISYESAYNHAAAVKLEVEEIVALPVTLSAGTYVVRTAQIQGRVATHLLEPETRDGVVYWNRMDAWLPKPAIAAYREGRAAAPHFPIYKLMLPLPLVTTLLPQDAGQP